MSDLFPWILPVEWPARAGAARGQRNARRRTLLRTPIGPENPAACAVIMPDRQLCVARELTKKFEEFRRGTAAELLAHYEARPAKGEITLVISGRM